MKKTDGTRANLTSGFRVTPELAFNENQLSRGRDAQQIQEDARRSKTQWKLTA